MKLHIFQEVNLPLFLHHYFDPKGFLQETFTCPREVGERAGEGDVVDVVAGRLRRTARPGPSRSSARRRASGCGRGTRPARRRGAPSRRDGSPRSARRHVSTSVEQRARPPSGCLRSTAMLRRPRCSTSKCGASGAGPRTACARSTRMTSAPMSASIMAANGPGPMPAISMMR